MGKVKKSLKRATLDRKPIIIQLGFRVNENKQYNM